MGKKQSTGHFLAGIAGLIRNSAGEYLLMKRIGQRDFGPDVWECVTGRVNQHESFEEALHREVMEETGLRVRIEALIGLTHFYRGGRVSENELQGVVFGCQIVGAENIVQSDEHSEYRWMSAEDALQFLTSRNPGTLWFRTTIERAEALYSKMPTGWADLHGSGVTLD